MKSTLTESKFLHSRTERHQTSEGTVGPQKEETTHRSNLAAPQAGPSAAVTSPGKAGSASTLTEVYASAKDATTSEVSAACTASCTEGYLKASSRDGGRCGPQPNLTPQGAEKGKPKGGKTREGGGRNRVRQDSPSFLVFTFVWGCHTESPANSLREVSRVSLQLTAVSGFTDYQFWGWCLLV